MNAGLNAGQPQAEPAGGATAGTDVVASDTPAAIEPSPRARARIRTLGWGAPLRWLARGLADLRRTPWIGCFYGFAFWAMAFLLGVVFNTRPEYTMSIVSGCLLVGPFLAIGLYDVSRRIERSEQLDLGLSLMCWDQRLSSMGLLLLVLMVLELLWGRASLVVFAVFFNTGMLSTAGVIQAIFNPENLEFGAAYLGVGFVFAALVFSSMAVSVPMILDRDTDAISSMLLSVRVVYDNVGVMLLWAALIVALMTLALLPWGAGLLVIGPWLGHATWHAYREAVIWPDEDGAGLDVEPVPGTQPGPASS